jgi:hypothetical protein
LGEGRRLVDDGKTKKGKKKEGGLSLFLLIVFLADFPVIGLETRPFLLSLRERERDQSLALNWKTTHHT